MERVGREDGHENKIGSKSGKKERTRNKASQTDSGLSSHRHQAGNRVGRLLANREEDGMVARVHDFSLRRHQFEERAKGGKRTKNKSPPNQEVKEIHTSLSHDVRHYMRGILRFSALDNTSMGILRRSGAWVACP